MGIPASLATVATTGVNFDTYFSVNTPPGTWTKPTTAYPAVSVNPSRDPVKVDITNATGNGFKQSARGVRSLTYTVKFVNLTAAPIAFVEGGYLNAFVPISGYGDFSGVVFVDKVSESEDVNGGFTVDVTFSSHGPYTLIGSPALT